MPKADVFVSYSHEDLAFVRDRLVPYVEAHQFTVLVDWRDFVAGSLSVEEMQRAVVECKRVVAVLSPAYVRSEWTTFENAMAQTADPAAINRKIIPVLLAECELPLRLRMIHHRDLSTDDPEQWNLLIRDLM